MTSMQQALAAEAAHAPYDDLRRIAEVLSEDGEILRRCVEQLVARLGGAERTDRRLVLAQLRARRVAALAHRVWEAIDAADLAAMIALRDELWCLARAQSAQEIAALPAVDDAAEPERRVVRAFTR